MKNAIIMFAVWFAASLAYADDAYLVEAKIYNEENLIGSPTLALKSSDAALIQDGEHYTLELSLIPTDETTAKLSATLTVNGEKISPSLLVELGKASTVKLGDLGLSVVVRKMAS